MPAPKHTFRLAHRCKAPYNPRFRNPPRNMPSGEVDEWLKSHAWKACLGLSPNVGSNPILSANNITAEYRREPPNLAFIGFFFILTSAECRHLPLTPANFSSNFAVTRHLFYCQHRKLLQNEEQVYRYRHPQCQAPR